MKKVFTSIGIAGAVFVIFFFLLTADKEVFYNNETVYDYEFDNQIDLSRIYNIAKKSCITVQLWEDGRSDFGNIHRTIIFINPTEEISEGRQASIFPEFKVVYRVWTNGQKPRKTNLFHVQENDKEKLRRFEKILEKEGYKPNDGSSTLVKGKPYQPMSMSLQVILSYQNFSFLFLLVLLTIFSYVMYCFSRLKAIGIYKINGISDERIINAHTLKTLRDTMIPFLVITGAAAIYVLFRQKKILPEYIYLLFAIALIMTAAYVISGFIILQIIKKISPVDAVKNLKYNRRTFVGVMCMKALVSVIIVATVSGLLSSLIMVTDQIHTANLIGKYDLYYISTSASLDKKTESLLLDCIKSFPDREVLNYRYPEHSYSAESIKNGRCDTADNADNILHISAGMLDYMHIRNTTGKDITFNNVKPDTLLIPENRKNDVDDIVSSSRLKKPDIFFIQNDQILDCIDSPGYHTFNAAIAIDRSEKSVSLPDGNVYFVKRSADKLRSALNDSGVSGQSFHIESLTDDTRMLLSNSYTTVAQQVILIVINGIVYILSVVAAAVIFMELRKKDIAVYLINGLTPARMFMTYLGICSGITAIASFIIDIRILPVLVIEIMINLAIMQIYIRKDLVGTLKGR